MSRRLIGAFLVSEGYISAGQLELGLRHQARIREARIGDILVELAIISRSELEKAVAAQIEALETVGKRQFLGEYLVSEGVVRQAELERGLAKQRKDREKRIGEVLVELGFLTERALNDAIRMQLDDQAQA